MLAITIENKGSQMGHTKKIFLKNLGENLTSFEFKS
jgi:hypothetical protein